MIIVINLLRNIFIIMFFILMILEIIVLIALILLYKIPLTNNIKAVADASQTNTIEIVNSFNFLFVRKYYNLATDLLLIAKHNFPMALTLNSSLENPSSYPKYNLQSEFVQSYNNSNCLINQSFLNNDINLYQNIVNSNNNFSSSTENDIINIAFNNPKINNLTFFPDYSFLNNPSNTLDPRFITYFCYTVSMLKTILVRNMIFEKQNGFVDRFLLFMNTQKFMLQYPN